jgi:hypothetical protein
MRAPASFEGTAIVHKYPGGVAALAERLDPQRWPAAFPYIWTACYFTKPTYFVQPISPSSEKGGVKKKVKVKGNGDDAVSPAGPPPTGQPPPRSEDPPDPNSPPRRLEQGAKARGRASPRRAMLPPPTGTNLFYEEALFGDYQYRNILKVTFTKNTGLKKKPHSASYEYSQHACLNAARDPLRVDGGIDVDCGLADVLSLDDSQIRVTINKQVRFTKPALLVDELNDLAHVFVPLSLDSWLHTLIFTDEENDNG